MPITTMQVEDSSPWISYQGGWGDSDSNTQFYSGATFHFANTNGASASITFNGTSVSLIGAKKQNHGFYGISLDNSNLGTFQGTTSDPGGDFNFTLYKSGPIAMQQHNVVLRNAQDGSFVDLDYALLTVGDNNPNTPAIDTTMDDTHPNITYDSHFFPFTNSLSPQYHNNTFHVSSTANSVATINFYGNAIALYGATSGNHGGYSVSLDGARSLTYNGFLNKTGTFRAQQLLYYASNLPGGMHSVKLTNLEDELFTDFDFAVATVYGPSTVSPSGSSADNSGSSSPAKSTSTPSAGGDAPVGAIVGGVVGGVILLGIIAFLLFLILRQRRRNAADAAAYARKGEDALGHEFAPGISVAAMAMYGGPRGPSPQRSYSNQASTGPAAYHGVAAGNGVGYSPGAAAGMAGGAASLSSQYGQAAYGTNTSRANDPFLGPGGVRSGGSPEMDMPPPDYDRVFTPATSSAPEQGPRSAVSSSTGTGFPPPPSSVTSAGGSSGGRMGLPPDPASTRVYRQLQEKGIPISADRDVRVNRMA